VSERTQVPVVVTPEVLPSLHPDITKRVEYIVRLNGEIQEHLKTFAELVVRVGLELLALKKEVGHGKWQAFFAERLAGPGFQERHAQRYMEVAAAVRVKLGGTEGAKRLLASGDAEADAAQQFAVIRETLADMTDATSWRQLWMDFGLMRPVKRRGGDHGGGAARMTAAQARTRMELDHALEQWELIIQHMREFALRTHRRLLVPPERLEEGLKSIRDCIRAIEKTIEKG